MSRAAIALGFFGSAAVAAGCSLLNAFDEVRPLSDGDASYGFANGNSSDGGPGADADASIQDAAPANYDLLVVAGAVDGPPLPGESEPTIVGVLTVLDPTTGHEIAVRETMTISGVVYDGTSDLWYIFESSGNFISGPTDTMTLHVRSLSSAGVWTEHQKLSVPTLYTYDLIAVTNQRLTYVGYAEGEAGLSGGLDLVTYDTSNTSSLVEIDHQGIAAGLSNIPSAPLALTGTPTTTGAGGRVALYRKGACAAGQCTLEVVSYLVSNSAAPLNIVDDELLANFTSFARPAWGTIQCPNRSDVIMYPQPKAADASTAFNVTIRYDPFTLPAGTEVGSPVAVPAFKGGFLRRAAIDSVDQILFAVETNTDLQLHAVSLVTGQATAVDTSHSGQSVYYDPASKTVFAPFNQGSGKSFTPFRVASDPDAGPTLTPRTSDWNPPMDLRPNLLGIHQPLPVKCN